MKANVIPLEGYALVGLRPLYQDFEGSFFIPRNARVLKMMGRVGEVCGITPYPDNQLSWVYEKGVLEAREAWRNNDEYISMLGKFVVCRQAVLVYGTLYTVRLEHMECIVPEGVRSPESDQERCRRCKAQGGELGVFLGMDGYCPVCGMNAFDEHITEEVIDVTETEIDGMVREPMEREHFLRTGGKAVNSTVYSYRGQKHRRGNIVLDDGDDSPFMRNVRRGW